MELYLDSANLREIEEGFKLGFLDGLTTTPHLHAAGRHHRYRRHHLEAVERWSRCCRSKRSAIPPKKWLQRQSASLTSALTLTKTVFKIPVSLEGVRACKMLRNEGLLVNVHLVYTLKQAYMAMHAGATYVCPLVGRLQDQGHDALTLVEQCVDAVETYGYDSKIMFSSVRHAEHVRNAINIGVHTITVPLKVLKAPYRKQLYHGRHRAIPAGYPPYDDACT